MGKQIELLDCTLRDGGYVNDWAFGHSVITGTYKRLDRAGVDYIEVGFLDDRRPMDLNHTIQPNTDAYNKIFEGIEKKHAIPVAMIDYGTCDISNIGECSSSFIDGIRVIFKKEKIEQALPFCKEIKKKGYKLFIQAISITSYSDLEMLEYIQKINEIKPYAFSIVDTYGLLDNRKLTNYFNLLNNNLDPEIKIGYHAHNNFQLAFSNSIKYLGLESSRTVVVDATVYGMGKSAGNCPSELIMMHMNDKYGTGYDIDQVLEILDTDLMAIYQKYYWGYKYNFYISALQNCHPNYVQFLLEKKTLSISAVNEILSQIPEEDKLLYNEQLIEQAYVKYQSHNIDDTDDLHKLGEIIANRNVLIIGPGKSIVNNIDDIKQYIRENNAVVISVNFEPKQFSPEFVFVSNAKRYGKLADCMNSTGSAKLILTSNITPFDRMADYTLNYQSLAEAGEAGDNALLLCLMMLIRVGVKKVELAGFDGFAGDAKDYYDCSYAFAGNEKYLVTTNEKIAKRLKSIGDRIKIHFLTESVYCGDQL